EPPAVAQRLPRPVRATPGQHVPGQGRVLVEPVASAGHDQLRSCFESGSERMRFPVAAKIALHSAGITGGSGGSPRPVGGLSVLRKCTSSSGGACVSRSSGKSWKLLCTARPRSMVISCPSASSSPSSTAPCTLFSALLGL